MFELEDLPWFPQTIRDLATDYLYFIETTFALHRPVVPLLRDAIERSRAAAIIDLCSGGGGPVLACHKALSEGGLSIPLTLTDKYPSLNASHRLSSLHPADISYIPYPVDAADVPRELTGIRTVFNAFHHFAPAAGRAVLKSAVEAGQPIAIFEIPERALTTIIPLFFTPLFIWIATPFMRPFQWRRLLWTYLFPLVPLTSWWDGIVSQFRAYTAGELLELTRAFESYDWNAARVRIGGTRGNLTYLVGIPKVS